MVARWERIINAKPMLEGIRPEMNVKIGSSEHSSHRIGDKKVASFNRTILIRSVGTSGTNVISKLVLSDFGVGIQFSTLIENNVFVLTVGGISSEEFVKPANQRCFGNSCVAVFHA